MTKNIFEETVKVVGTKKSKTDSKSMSDPEAPIEDSYGDMSNFKKTTKGMEVNQRAYEREMPDESIIEEIKLSGINEAMKNYVPQKGTTLIRTKEEAQKVIAILR